MAFFDLFFFLTFLWPIVTVSVFGEIILRGVQVTGIFWNAWCFCEKVLITCTK